jgi:hypothetical protein
MGFFNKLFDAGKNKSQSDEVKEEKHLKACKSETELLERYGGIAFDRKMDLDSVVGNLPWNVDMKKGEISFGADLAFPFQILGTFSYASETWLWAWANTKSGLSESVTQEALQLKKYGEENEIDLLRNSEFDASHDDLLLIGLIASGMFHSSGFYIADYGQGAMVITIRSQKIDKLPQDNHLRILSAFPQLISRFEMNHMAALKNYLSAKGYQVTSTEKNITGIKGENKISAEFDSQFRMTEING